MGKAKQLVCLVAASIALAATIHVDAYAQLRGQLIAGTDNGTRTINVKTDSAGRIEVVGAAAGGSIYGVDAVNTAPTQPPLMQACFGSASGPSAVTSGRVQYVWCDVNGRVNVNAAVTGSVSVTQSTSPWVVGQSTASALNATVVGSGPVGASTAQAGSMLGGLIYTATAPTVTNGQQIGLQGNGNGSLYAVLRPLGTENLAFGGNSQTVAFANSSVVASIFGSISLLNGGSAATTLERGASLSNQTTSLATGVGVGAGANVPTNAAAQAVTQQRSTAVASSLVLCSAACNLYDFAATSGAVSGYILVFDATSAPADGAVTPAFCRAMSANSSTEVDYSITPRRMTTGATLVYSSTGCFTKTASATAMLEGASKQ